MRSENEWKKLGKKKGVVGRGNADADSHAWVMAQLFPGAPPTPP
jgi:hypothetical protein